MQAVTSLSLLALLIFILAPEISSFISSKTSFSLVSKAVSSPRTLAPSKNPLPLSRESIRLWEQNPRNDEVVKSGDSSDETVKKYGLEMGILKTYFDKSSKVKPKDLISRYGIAYFGTSITLAIISYALCYVLIANGVDVASLLQKIGIKPSEAAVSAGTGGLAYAVHKAASPIRFVPTIILTPLVAKWIGKKPKEEVAEDTASKEKESL